MLDGMGPPLPDGATLPEVRRGFLREPPPAPSGSAIDRRFLQEAPPWGWLEALPDGAEIEVEGCLPAGASFAARLPPQPAADVAIDGAVTALELRPTKLVVRPEADEVVVAWWAVAALPRPFVPGLHAKIPIEVRLGGERFSFPTPPVAFPHRRPSA
jgi:hypothetical protein